jgi:hypothetical protein
VFKVVFVRRSCTIFHCQGKKLSAVDGEEAVVSTEKLARGMTNDLILPVLYFLLDAILDVFCMQVTALPSQKENWVTKNPVALQYNAPNET